jgi:hypothetical protein
MSEELFTCPQCGRGNFTKRDLAAHVCRAGGAEKARKPDELKAETSQAAGGLQPSDLQAFSPFMSREERARLKQLEGYIGLTRAAAGAALREIRDTALYRESHKSVEDYVEKRWGIAKRTAYYWIEEADKRGVQKLHSNGSFSLNKDGTIETDGDGAGDDDGEAGPAKRPADARRVRDLELLAAGEAEGLSEEMRGSIARAAGRLCAIENKGMNAKQAAALLPDYERRVEDRLTEIAPAFAELVRGGEMKSGRAVAGMMGELNKGMPRAPVNHLHNLEAGLQKLMTSLHLWEELPEEEAADSRRRRMTKWVGQLAPHFPLEWRKALLAAWREGGRE